MTKAVESKAEPAVTPRRRVRRQAPTVRRQDLLAVTISCLARLGARGTTGREICRQAGVSHGLLRHYFKNPENLLLETYQEPVSYTHLDVYKRQRGNSPPSARPSISAPRLPPRSGAPSAMSRRWSARPSGQCGACR